MITRGFNKQFFLRAALAALVGIGSGFFFHLARGYFPRIAVLIGLSIGILTYMAIQTLERLWRLWRPSQADLRDSDER